MRASSVQITAARPPAAAIAVKNTRSHSSSPSVDSALMVSTMSGRRLWRARRPRRRARLVDVDEVEAGETRGLDAISARMIVGGRARRSARHPAASMPFSTSHCGRRAAQLRQQIGSLHALFRPLSSAAPGHGTQPQRAATRGSAQAHPLRRAAIARGTDRASTARRPRVGRRRRRTPASDRARRRRRASRTRALAPSSLAVQAERADATAHSSSRNPMQRWNRKSSSGASPSTNIRNSSGLSSNTRAARPAARDRRRRSRIAASSAAIEALSAATRKPG